MEMKKTDIGRNPNLPKLKHFFKKYLGIEIDDKILLFKDLELIGDDADEFLKIFSKEFKIDMSNFIFADYFIEEYNIPFHYWYDKFFNKEKMRRKSFDIHHLLKVIDKGCWVDI